MMRTLFHCLLLLALCNSISAAVSSQPFKQSTRARAGQTLFEDLPPERTGIHFHLQLPDVEKNIHEIIHLSVYGGLCTGDFDGDGLADLFATSPAGSSRLFRNRGDFRFEDVSEVSGIITSNFWATGASFVDIDNDGDLDLYICAYKQPNRLYINQGRDANGLVRFTEKARDFGLDFRGASMMMAFADYDKDGDLDGYLCTSATPPPPGVKLRLTQENGRTTVPKELREYWGVISLPNGQPHPTEAGQYDHFFRNDGARFTEVSEEAGIDGAYFTLSAIWCDFNNDGWPDIYVANDYLGPDILYQNNGRGGFTNVIRATVPHTPWSSMGMDIADLNNDGLIDLMTTDMLGSTDYRRKVMAGETSRTGWFLDIAEPRQYNRNAVFINTSAGGMMEAAYLTGMAATDWTWGPRLEDFDNDGRVDVFIANGMMRDVQNADLGLFADRTFGGGSAAWAKFWAAQPMQKEANFAFRNAGDLRFENVSTNWGLGRVGVSLGSATADFDNDGALDLAVLNADAPLSIYRNRTPQTNSVTVRLRGKPSNRFGIGATARLRAGGLEHTRYLTLNRAWLSASDPLMHFGLGAADKIESLKIEWPSGRAESFTNLQPNRLYTIAETDSTNSQAELDSAKTLFATSSLLSSVRMADPAVDDFANNPLLPKRISQRGMPIAAVSSNLFIGNPSRLFRNFEPAAFPNVPNQSTAALFIDVDRDKDHDLLVVGEFDQLFLNDGKDVFTLAWTNAARGDVIAAGTDYVFIGAYGGQYPRSTPSRLLTFKEGKFFDLTPAAFSKLSLVTGAVWIDKDLFVACEWGPIHCFRNDNGTFVDQAESAGLAKSIGLWSALTAVDINGDGTLDLIAGNIGLNTPYHASPEQPAMLFYGDLDGSGSSNILEAHFLGELGFPNRGLDTLAQAMPSLRAKFSTFDQFARAPIEQITTMNRLRQSYRRQATVLESGVFINDGKAHFHWRPLPRLAQIAPVRDIAAADVNADGKIDLVLAQNDFSPHREIGRMDGGVGLLLTGDGQGSFTPMWPNQSGIVVPGEARRVQVIDLNNDGRLDILFASSPPRVFLSQK